MAGENPFATKDERGVQKFYFWKLTNKTFRNPQVELVESMPTVKKKMIFSN